MLLDGKASWAQLEKTKVMQNFDVKRPLSPQHPILLIP